MVYGHYVSMLVLPTQFEECHPTLCIACCNFVTKSQCTTLSPAGLTTCRHPMVTLVYSSGRRTTIWFSSVFANLSHSHHQSKEVCSRQQTRATWVCLTLQCHRRHILQLNHFINWTSCHAALLALLCVIWQCHKLHLKGGTRTQMRTLEAEHIQSDSIHEMQIKHTPETYGRRIKEGVQTINQSNE